ncbi:MAG TPA: hypothetical protein VEY96_05550 [Actinomycetes bacterium]|nr:hypothetical protein [Actinomycetes bacterium]
MAVQRRQPPGARPPAPVLLPGEALRKRARRERRTLELLVDSPFNHQVGPWFRDWVREAATLAGRAG